jgi:general secretion pathway protein B
MSFIHEALKRSDRARRLLGATRDAPAEPPPLVGPRLRWLPWAGALLLANAALVGWLLLRPATPEPQLPPAAGEVRSLAREAGDGATASGRAPLAADAPPGAPPDALAAADPDAVPALDALSATERAGWPALHVDAHAWSPDPAQRFAIINLKRRVVGDALDGGVTLVEITADGVVVELRGRRAFIARQ